MWIAAAIACQIAGFEVLRRSRKQVLKKVLGWGLFAVSIVIFAQIFSIGPGIAWALACLSVVGYGLITYPFFIAEQIGIDKRAGRFNPAAARETTGIHLAERLICAGPLSLLAASGIAMVLATKLQWTEVNRLIFAVFLMPPVWSLGALHATVDVKRLRVWGMPLGVIAASAALFLLL